MRRRLILSGMIFLTGVLILSLVAASSYSSSNPNYGLFKKYDTGTSDSLKWSDDFCNAGQDFVLQIAPYGCEPSVVRSDLLEEQNVPVFCAIAATQVNPLIDVEAIESMTFSGQYPDAVSGVGFHPARAALGVQGDINSPILNNVGYAVIVLRQQENEAEMPDFVEGNLTAKIRYDVKNAFGIGETAFYLPELSESDFEDVKDGYSFWDGKFFLRAERVEENYVTVSIYDGVRKLSSVTLEKGKTSDKIALPGFSCLAKLELKLDAIENPGTTAKLKINGEIIEVVEGEKFLDNNCRVVDISKDGLMQSVKLSCYGDEGRRSFTLGIDPTVEIKVDEIIQKGEMGQKVGDTELIVSSIKSKNKNSGKGEDLIVELKDGDGKKYNLAYGKETEIGSKKIVLEGFFVEDEASLEGEAKEDYENALADYDSIINSFRSSTEGCTGYENCGEKAYIGKIKLASSMMQFKTAAETCREFEEKYPDSLQEKPLACSREDLLSSSESVGHQVTINYEVNEISLVSVYEADFDSYGAEVIVDGEKYELTKDKVVYLQDEKERCDDVCSGYSYGEFAPRNDLTKCKEGFTGEYDALGDKWCCCYNSGTPSGGREYLQLVSISDDTVKVKVYLDKESSESYVSGTYDLKKNVHEKFGSVHDIYLANVNVENYAKVSVISDIDNVGTSSDFSFKIGIEKRAVSLAPEVIQEKIDSLNDTIEKWEERSEKLGAVVKGLKSACLATGTVLIAKNFLLNQKDSLARTEVISYWDKKCTAHMSGAAGKQIEGKEGKKYASLDACLADNADEIDAAVSSRSQSKEETSDEFSLLQEGTVTKKGWLGLEEVVDEKDLWVNIRDSNLLNTLQGDLEVCYPDGMRINNKDVPANELVGRINENTTTITGLRDMIANAKDCADNPEIAKSELDKSLSKLYQASRVPEKMKAFGEKTGFPRYSTVMSSEKTTTIPVDDFLGYGNIRGYTFASENDRISSEDHVYFIQDDVEAGKEYLVVYNDYGKVEQTFSIGSDNKLTKTWNKNPMKVKFELVDSTTYHNRFISSYGETKPVIRYYETEPFKGLPASVPFDLNNGWYVSITSDVGFGAGSASYDDSGAVKNYYLCNVGKDWQEDDRGEDDKCQLINKGTGRLDKNFNGLDENEVSRLLVCAEDAIKQASKAYGKNPVHINTVCGGSISLPVGNPAANVPDMQCQNFMSPTDCQILFNVCDPVICPSSRCNFGGSYQVADVTQQGIIGGIFLCLPNFIGTGGDVVIPVCLSGIKAGIDGLLSVFKSYRDCLQENLDTGKTVGVCDEIYSVYLCEFLWKQALPLAKYSVPKIIEKLIGQGTRGGGEYFKFMNAIDVADNSINYFTNYYAANSFEAFKARSAEDVGSEVCKNYVSGVGPDVDSMIDSFTNPDSPAQFHGRFDEIEFTTATVPATSQYKVWYHIYAGDDESAYYQVYLKGGAESSYYHDATSTRLVASGYVNAGEYVDETKDFTAPSGFTKMCIRVNNQEECGFKEVSTSFAVNYVKDEYLSSQATETDINSEDECVSGTVNSEQILAAMVTPNLQEGAESIVDPQIYKRGIIRVCATDNPGVGTDAKAGGEDSRWTDVGWCDEKKGIKCWLDGQSVEEVIKTTSVEGDTLEELNANYLEKLRNSTEVGTAESAIENLESENDALTIVNTVNKYFDDLIMNYHKIKALFLRAKAYGILAKGEKYLAESEGEETVVGEGNAGEGGASTLEEVGIVGEIGENVTQEERCDYKAITLHDSNGDSWDLESAVGGLGAVRSFISPKTLVIEGEGDCEGIEATIIVEKSKNENVLEIRESFSDSNSIVLDVSGMFEKGEYSVDVSGAFSGYGEFSVGG